MLPPPDHDASAGIDRQIADAYSATALSWRSGPAQVYGRLADDLVARSGRTWVGASVLDIGAGTGVASAALARAGAGSLVAVDTALEMLSVDATERPPAVAADARRLPFAAATFDGAIAAFVFNHLDVPADGLAEATRVVRSGGVVLASAYADDDHHPVRDVVERNLRGLGWEPDTWYRLMRADLAPRLSTEDRCREVLIEAGLAGSVERRRVAMPDLETTALVEWRLGMAQHANFLAALTADDRRRVRDDCIAELGPDAPPLVRSMMVIVVDV
jgi:SAM-dependent methyltransferase